MIFEGQLRPVDTGSYMAKIMGCDEAFGIEAEMTDTTLMSICSSSMNAVYRLLYRNFKLKELKQKITEGYGSLCSWLKEIFVELRVPELCEVPEALPGSPS